MNFGDFWNTYFKILIEYELPNNNIGKMCLTFENTLNLQKVVFCISYPQVTHLFFIEVNIFFSVMLFSRKG